jgi:hypothetical protein
MEARGTIFIEGIDVIIRRDLDKHKSLLEKNNMDIQAFENAINSEIQRKKFYVKQKGQKKYDDTAMDVAIEQMRINITHLGDRLKITKELRRQNTQIVDTLTPQLVQYYVDLKNSKN